MYQQPQTKKISIVMPNWFTENQHGKYGQNETFVMASRCLKRLIDITPKDQCELILIDNGSTLKNPNPDWWIEYPNIVDWYWNQADILIRNKSNLGFAPAINQGVNAARGEYIIAINNDIFLFNEDWIDELIKPFSNPELNPKAGIVQPNIIKKEYQKDCLNEHGRLDMKKVFALKKEDIILPHKDEIEPHAEFGSCYIIPKVIVEKIKVMNKEELGKSMFYDENFLLGMGEDRKLWQQIRILGYETYRTNRFRVAHIGNLTIGKIPDRKKYTFANREYLAKWKKKHNL